MVLRILVRRLALEPRVALLTCSAWRPRGRGVVLCGLFCSICFVVAVRNERQLPSISLVAPDAVFFDVLGTRIPAFFDDWSVRLC